MPCRPAVMTMNVKPSPPHAAERHCRQRGARVAQQAGLLQRRDPFVEQVAEHTDLRLQQHEPHQAGHCDAGGDGAAERGAEEADAPQVLVREDRQADAEDQPGGHGHRCQLQRHAERVLELPALPHIAELLPADVVAPPAGGIAALRAVDERHHQRVHGPHREQRHGRHQHGERRRHVAQAALHGRRSPLAASKRCTCRSAKANSTTSPAPGRPGSGGRRAVRASPSSPLPWASTSTS